MDANDHIKCACPTCQKKFNLESRYAGKKARCPQCQSVFTIPSISAPQANSASTAGQMRDRAESSVAAATPSAAEEGITISSKGISRHKKIIIGTAVVAFAGIALIVLALTGWWEGRTLHEAADWGDLAGVKRHVEKGENVNARDDKGETPLHLAASGGYKAGRYKEIAEYLIAHGANVNAKDDDGETPLHNAAS